MQNQSARTRTSVGKKKRPSLDFQGIVTFNSMAFSCLGPEVLGPRRAEPYTPPGVFPDLCHAGDMEWLAIAVTLLMFGYAGLFSMFAADFKRLDNPINLFLVLVGVALIIGGVCVCFWIYMQPKLTY